MLFLQLCHGIHFASLVSLPYSSLISLCSETTKYSEKQNYRFKLLTLSEILRLFVCKFDLDADIRVMKDKTPADKNHLFCQLCGFYQ